MSENLAALRSLSVVFENMVALAQEGEVYLQDLGEHPGPPELGGLSHSRRPTLLIVDDNRLILRSLERTLKSHFDLVTATTVAAGRRLVAETRFDAVVSDFHLTDSHGSQVLLAAMRANPWTYRLLFTADAANKRIVNTALLMGLVHEVVQKPVGADELRLAVASGVARMRRDAAWRESPPLPIGLFEEEEL